MLQALRNNTRVILWITIAAFVGLILLVWGADLQVSSSNGGSIAKVNGNPVPYQYYQDAYYNNLEAYRAQSDRELSFADEQQIREQTFNAVVADMLIDQEARELGVPLTDEEVVFWIKNQPHPEIINSPQFQNAEGEFDIQKYHEALRADPASWRQYEEYMRQSLPADKLRRMVLTAGRVSESEVDEYVHGLAETRVLSYIRIDPRTAELPEGAVDEAAMRAHYDAHAGDYQTGERARLRLVRIAKEPSADDEEEVLTELQEHTQDVKEDLAKSFEEGKQTFAAAVAAFSDGANKEQGGDRGAAFIRDRIRPEELANAVFETPVGTLAPPFRVGNRYYLVLVTEEDEEGGRRFSTFERILRPGPDTLDKLRQSLRGWTKIARADGIEAAASATGLEASLTEPFTERGFVPELFGFQDAIAFAFANPPGAVGGPDESEQAWLLYEVAEHLPSEPIPFEEAKNRILRTLTTEQQFTQARAQAAPVVAQLERRGLEAAAKAADLEITETQRVNQRGGIPGVGADPALMTEAFALPEGSHTGLIETDQGLFVVRVDSVFAASADELQEYRSSARQILEQERSLKVFEGWIERLRAAANVEDFR